MVYDFLFAEGIAVTKERDGNGNPVAEAVGSNGPLVIGACCYLLKQWPDGDFRVGPLKQCGLNYLRRLGNSSTLLSAPL